MILADGHQESRALPDRLEQVRGALAAADATGSRRRGGCYPYDLVDGAVVYPSWEHGVAFPQAPMVEHPDFSCVDLSWMGRCGTLSPGDRRPASTWSTSISNARRVGGAFGHAAHGENAPAGAQITL